MNTTDKNAFFMQKLLFYAVPHTRARAYITLGSFLPQAAIHGALPPHGNMHIEKNAEKFFKNVLTLSQYSAKM